MPVPTRKTEQVDVDAWNAEMRQSPVYLEFMQSQGLPTDGRAKLSTSQQEGLERALAAAGMPVPSGMHVDQGGNLNQKNTLKKNVAKYSAYAGLAATGLGAAGIGPMAGVMGASAAGGAGGLGAAGAVGSAPAYVPASMIGTGLGGGATAAGGLGAAGAAKAGLGFLGRNSDLLGGAGQALGVYSQGQANNRRDEYGAQYGQAQLGLQRERLESQRDSDYQSQSIAREQEGRASGTDAWRKLLSAQHTLSPGARPQLSPYSVAPRVATEAERTGASAMSEEVMKRIQSGNQAPAVTRRPGLPTDMGLDPTLLRPSVMERTTGWLSPILQGVGAYYGRGR